MVFRTNSTSCPLSFFSIMAIRKRRSDMAILKAFVYSEKKNIEAFTDFPITQMLSLCDKVKFLKLMLLTFYGFIF